MTSVLCLGDGNLLPCCGLCRSQAPLSPLQPELCTQLPQALLMGPEPRGQLLALALRTKLRACYPLGIDGNFQNPLHFSAPPSFYYKIVQTHRKVERIVQSTLHAHHRDSPLLHLLYHVCPPYSQFVFEDAFQSKLVNVKFTSPLKHQQA